MNQYHLTTKSGEVKGNNPFILNRMSVSNDFRQTGAGVNVNDILGYDAQGNCVSKNPSNSFVNAYDTASNYSQIPRQPSQPRQPQLTPQVLEQIQKKYTKSKKSKHRKSTAMPMYMPAATPTPPAPLIHPRVAYGINQIENYRQQGSVGGSYGVSTELNNAFLEPRMNNGLMHQRQQGSCAQVNNQRQQEIMNSNRILEAYSNNLDTASTLDEAFSGKQGGWQ